MTGTGSHQESDIVYANLNLNAVKSKFSQLSESYIVTIEDFFQFSFLCLECMSKFESN